MFLAIFVCAYCLVPKKQLTSFGVLSVCDNISRKFGAKEFFVYFAITIGLWFFCEDRNFKLFLALDG